MRSILFLIAISGQSPSLVVVPNWALLMRPSVQTALELTVPQTRELAAIRGAAATLKRRLSRKRSGRAPKPVLGMPDLALSALTKFGKALSNIKQARLAQITLQSYGPQVFRAPTVQKALGMSSADVDRISRLQAAAAAVFNEKVRQYAATNHLATRVVQGNLEVTEETPEIRQAYDDRDAKLSEVLRQNLSPDQNGRLAKLLGKPVKLN